MPQSSLSVLFYSLFRPCVPAVIAFVFCIFVKLFDSIVLVGKVAMEIFYYYYYCYYYCCISYRSVSELEHMSTRVFTPYAHISARASSISSSTSPTPTPTLGTLKPTSRLQ